MKLEQSFEVDAPLEQVWALLIDVQRVAPCLPGAELTEVADDGTYHGTFSVKIGPAKASYRGSMTMESVDEAAHEVKMRANGTDKRGQGGAKALMHSKLSARDGGGTHVEVETDLTITGRLASFSRGGMIQDVSNRLLDEFASCLQAQLVGEPPSPTGATGQVESAAATAAGPATEASDAAEAGDVAAAQAPPGASPTGATSPPPPAPGTTQPRAASTPQAGKPINGLQLFLGVLRDRLRRLFKRGKGRGPRSGR